MSTTAIRVTLEKPYRMKNTGEELPLVLAYGMSEARILHQNSSVAYGNLAADADDFVDAGSFQNLVPRSVRRMRPGKPITWELWATDETKRSVNVAVEAARLWFGDWRLSRQAEPGTPYEDTYGYERNRVATRWGYWIMPQTTASGKTHTSRGAEPADMTKIGPPRVPHVLIQDVDERGVVGGKLQFRPWEHFEWESDVVPTFDGSQQAVSAGIETFTIDQLRSIVAAHDEKAKAQAAKVK